ncbi:MAG: PAS domain S-box protein, partial [Candidatus Poribacteria bacterium]
MQGDNLLDEKNLNKQTEDIIEPSMLKEIIDNLDYGVVITDLDGNIVYVNEHFSFMHGYRPEELLAKHISMFHTDDQMTLVNELMKKLKENGIIKSTKIWHKYRDGNVFPTIMNGIILKDKGGRSQFMSIATVDVSVRRRIREKLEIRNRIANVFLISDEDEVCENVVNIIAEILQSKFGVFCYLDEHRNIICPNIFKYFWDNHKPENLYPHNENKHIWNKAIAEKKTIIINEKPDIPDKHVHISRIIVVPIIYHENVIGIIALAN